MEGSPPIFKNLINSYAGLVDPRIERSKLYPLNEIVFLSVCAVLSGLEDWDEIADFGEEKLNWLRQYLPYENGTPSHDTINRVISMLDYRSFEACFIDWTTKSIELPRGIQICVDGKSLRGSATKQEQQTAHADGGKSAIHVVHAWCNALEICLGQYKTSEKSNEITAIPALLELLEISGSIVSMDAMGCQKKIAQTIVDKEADYIFGLKGNQESLYLGVFSAFNPPNKTPVPINPEIEKNHGRLETRLCRILPASELPEFANREEWKCLKTIVEITSSRKIIASGKCQTETRYYVSSLDTTPEKFNELIRSHWGIENKLHWILDVVMGEDQSQKQIRNAAQNFSTLRKIALNLLKTSNEKISINRKQSKCALSDAYRQKILGF